MTNAAAILRHSSAEVFHLKLGKSKKLVDDYVLAYNSGRKLNEQLRPGHRQLVEKLLWMYSLELERTQAYAGPISAGSILPVLYTNNAQLARAMGCCRRSIINLLSRLLKSGLVASKDWRGSNTSYALSFNLAVIWLESRQSHPHNAAAGFQPPAPAPGAPAQAPQGGVKTLRHTVTGKETRNLKINKLSGASCQPAAPAAGAQDGAEAPADNRQPGSVQATTPGTPSTGNEEAGNQPGTAPPVAAPPPAQADDLTPEAAAAAVAAALAGPWVAPAPTAPDNKTTPAPAGLHGLNDNNKERCSSDRVRQMITNGAEPSPDAPIITHIADVLDQLPPEALPEKIRWHVSTTWSMALTMLWPDSYICSEQREKAQAMLALYFAAAQPHRYADVAAQLRERISLVHRWVTKCRAQGRKAFVPVNAGDWFDPRNPRGFTVSKAWWLQHTQNRKAIKDKELLTKAVNAYTRALLGIQNDPQAGLQWILEKYRLPAEKPWTPVTAMQEAFRQITQTLAKRDRSLLEEFHQSISTI